MEELYAVVFLDTSHYYVRSGADCEKSGIHSHWNQNVRNQGNPEYVPKGQSWGGKKESAKYWLPILIGLKNRGVEDNLIACVDGFNRIWQYHEAVYPKTEYSSVFIHQIRNITRFVFYKDIKALMSHLKRVYAAVDEETASYELKFFGEKWNAKYPKIAQS